MEILRNQSHRWISYANTFTISFYLTLYRVAERSGENDCDSKCVEGLLCYSFTCITRATCARAHILIFGGNCLISGRNESKNNLSLSSVPPSTCGRNDCCIDGIDISNSSAGASLSEEDSLTTCFLTRGFFGFKTAFSYSSLKEMTRILNVDGGFVDPNRSMIKVLLDTVETGSSH